MKHSDTQIINLLDWIIIQELKMLLGRESTYKLEIKV